MSFIYNPFPGAEPDDLVASILARQAALKTALSTAKLARREVRNLRARYASKLKTARTLTEAPYRFRQAIKALDAAEARVAELTAGTQERDSQIAAPTPAAAPKVARKKTKAAKKVESRSARLLRKARAKRTTPTKADRASSLAALDRYRERQELAAAAVVQEDRNTGRPGAEILKGLEQGREPYRGTGDISRGTTKAERITEMSTRKPKEGGTAKAAEYAARYTALWRAVDQGRIKFLGEGHGKPKPRKSGGAK